ncbi:MAG TPA: bestrophin family protein, partial [Polyangiaceae bacterium]|nr:bestrophin family protein [Polyangiaceae bacterium]
RFWEGRRLLGGLTNRTRDLMRQVVGMTEGSDADASRERAEVQRLVVLFYRLTAQSLRDENELEPLADLLTPAERALLEPLVARPGVVATWISTRLVREARRSGTSEERLLAMDANLTALIDNWGGCERIRRTPVPFAYAQHIKVFVTVWCFSVPFALVDTMRLYTPFAAALLALALFGIDEIGVEIEDPFGYDPNDLPLDAIADRIRVSTGEIVSAGRPGAAT